MNHPGPGTHLTISHLFVYGTLRPGDVRWPMLEPFVVDHGWDDAVPGRLFDTGLGYPAAIFDTAGAMTTVYGRTFGLLGTSLGRALELLDVEEDTVEGLYRRVRVVTARGVAAWAYAYGDGLDLTPIESGDWFTRSTA
ncbi:MAG: gamma-glutamylcyclotransferase [Ilumatobacter sp.]|nr:MAG: gamma-glutamylcyclotransferase [Ilumatobacter sp.]